MNTRFGRAFRYEVRNYFRAVAILWLVMALIPAAMLAITYFLAGETAMEGSFNGYSIAVGMFGLVLGMVGLRENQRVLNQNGLEYTADNIDELMLQRHENKKLLRAGKHPKGTAKRTKEQDIRFCDALERILSGTSGNQQTECENVSFARR